MNALTIVQQFYPDVRHVKDAIRPLRIEVTKEDAESRAVRKHKDCALAVACKKMEMVDGAIISVAAAYLVKGDTAIRYKVPQSVAREIVSFDRSGGFEQGEYWLDKPAHKLGAPGASGSNKRRAKPVKKSRFRNVTKGIRTDLRKATQEAHV